MNARRSLGMTCVAMVGVLAVYQWTIPSPSQFQDVAIRVIFALLTAMAGALLPDLMSPAVGRTPGTPGLAVRAAGSVALFALVYFFFPS